MLTLALDTTTRGGSAAVMRGRDVLAVIHGDAMRTHGERLPGELDAALRLANVNAQDLELLVVASGPGAFTGLRIGLAAIQGLAMVIGAPTIGVSALDALALAARDERRDIAVAAWMDAQRGEVFAALYEQSPADDDEAIPVETPLVARPEEVLDRLAQARSTSPVFVGDGASRYRGEIERMHPGTAILETPLAVAPFLARIGQHRAARGQAGPPHALQPLYVRRSDAELARARQT